MRGNADALAAKAPCLIVGFKGLKGFSPRQIAEVQGEKWPGLRAETIDFPGFEDSPDHYCEQLSQTLETPEIRDRLVEALRPLVGHAEYVGLPAVLGLYRTREIHRRLEEGLGVRVFEIPTMPPGIPGLRMWERFSEELRGRGVRIHTDANVLAVRRNDSDFELDLGLYGRASETVRARNVLLAGGRCLGGGLRAKRDRLVEPLFGLPVRQPGGRDKWHGQDFLDAGGHPVNRAGLDVDDDFRPLDESGRPTQGLYAAGAILAGQDWVREKCGSGLALATALRAVEALTRSG
jgi:glycerol-3-phosphate dehydrogenase subunit B